MALPDPVPGLVVCYSYLWSGEYRRGQEEGIKDRPCAVILTMKDEAGETFVLVLPVTHVPPADPALVVEIPHATKKRLGLDDARSWVVLTEANRFRWPGPDLRPAPGRDGVVFGQLPYRFFEEIRVKFIATVRAARAGIIPRSE